MPITPADIEQLTFSPSKHGYDTEEVDAFLEQLSDEVAAMLEKIADLKGRLNAAEQKLASSEAQVASLEAARSDSSAGLSDYEAPAPHPAAAEASATERQISQALIVAQQSADRIVEEAKDSAEEIRSDADQKAREVIRQALAEKQAELNEIDRLKKSCAEFRDEYKNLLQHFLDDADKSFEDEAFAGIDDYAADEADSANARAYAADADDTPNVDDLD